MHTVKSMGQRFEKEDENIKLRIKGAEKVCIVGTNGAGKTTLLRKIADELINRNDIKAEYMPKNYEDMLNLDVTPVDFLEKSGDKKERTRIRIIGACDKKNSSRISGGCY